MSSFTFKITSIARLLKQIDDLKKKDHIIEALKANGNINLKKILNGLFNPNVKFVLPEGTPPYRPSKFDEPKALLGEINRLYLFVEGGNNNLKPIRREQLFIEILEHINADDAELLIAMKDKKNPFKHINEKIIREAFPEMF